MTHSASSPQDIERVTQSLTGWLKKFIISGIWRIADDQAAELLNLEGSPEIRSAIAEFRSSVRQAEAAEQATRNAEEASIEAQRKATLEQLHKTMEDHEATIAETDRKRRGREERNQRLSTGRGTAQDREEEQRDLEEILHGPSGQEMAERLIQEAKEVEERLAAADRRLEAAEESTRTTKADLERNLRLSRGVGTEDDLANLHQYGESENDPWPEPVLAGLLPA